MNSLLSSNHQLLEFEVIFEDQDLVVINKPAGVVVNRSTTSSQATVQDWMDQKLQALPAGQMDVSDWVELIPADFSPEYGTPQQIFMERLGMVHRLDKDTSGVLLLAKNPGALVNLLAQFRDRIVKKRYLCLTHGFLPQKSGEISAPIGRQTKNRQRFGVVAGGRDAVTHYQVKSEFSGLTKQAKQDLPPQARLDLYQGFSLVECWPQTGRTHQIRVHLQYLAHPIVGDEQYLGKKRAKLDRWWCPRQFLHAAGLEILHPRTGEKLAFEAPLTPDLQQVLKLLDFVE